jgi:hypothetical protein
MTGDHLFSSLFFLPRTLPTKADEYTTVGGPKKDCSQAGICTMLSMDVAVVVELFD